MHDAEKVQTADQGSVEWDLSFTEQQARSVAAQIVDFDTPQSVFANYIVHNKDTNLKGSERLFQICSVICDVGHTMLPRQIRPLLTGKDVLDFGCGTTMYGAAFRAIGARSYVGVDPVIDLSRRRFRSRRLKATVNTGVSLESVMLRIPRIEYYQNADILEERSFDTIILHTVTEHLHDIESLFSRFQKALNPGGSIWFLHTNFYSWSGHNQDPKSLKDFDPENPEHLKYADWAHVDFDAPPDHVFQTHLNRLRIGELRDLTERYFSIVEWTPVEDKPPVQARLTPEIERRLGRFSRTELLTKQVICLARKPTL